MRFATTLLVLACMLSWAQAAPRPAPKTSFPAIDELDRRERLLQIRSQSLLLRQDDQQRKKEINAVFAAMGRLPKQESDEKTLLIAIQIQRDLIVAMDGLKNDRDRCLKILEMISAASREKTLNNETLAFLKGERNRTTNVLRLATLQSRRLHAAAKALKNTLRTIPPPASFVNRQGLTMVLIADGKDSFYISQEPVSAEKLKAAYANTKEPAPAAVNWYAAHRYAIWLSETESALYRLPTLAHMETFVKHGGKVPEPVWTQTPDEPANNEERKMRTRFGVDMVTVFDPAGKLGDKPVMGELPFAAYPQMQFHVVTPAETGWRFRWNTLKQTLDK
jgi:formylglycine-generating enzyme required for sulfatase activity